MDEIRQDQEIQVIQRESLPMQEKIAMLTVVDESSAKLASTYLSFIAKAVKKLEDRRVFFTKPILESKKNIDAEFKAMIEPLKDMATTIKDKLLWYSKEQTLKEQERIKKVNEFAEKNNLPVPITPEQARPDAIRTSIGSTFTQKRWAWRVVDEAKIPREYLTIDEKKITAMMRAETKTVRGVSSMNLTIDGIEFYQEDSIAVRT